MEHRVHFFGWSLFLLCSVLFLVSGIRNHDPWSTAASVLFGLGVTLFLVPLWAGRRR